MLTVDAIKEITKGGSAANIKYVRLENGFRYAIAGGPIEHKHLVKDGEKPISAGFFSYFKDGFFHLHPMQSATLQLGPHEEDAALLKTIFT